MTRGFIRAKQCPFLYTFDAFSFFSRILKHNVTPNDVIDGLATQSEHKRVNRAAFDVAYIKCDCNVFFKGDNCLHIY